MLACWHDSRTNQYVSKFGAEYEQKELLQAISEVDFVVAQNAKFELGWLDRCGVDLHNILVWDTMLAEWIVLGNKKEPKDLSSMLKRRGLKGKEDVVGGMIKLGISPENIPKKLLETYCLEDVRGTKELFDCQIKGIVQRDQLHLVYARCLLTPVLTDIEKNGVCLDKEAVEEEYENVRKEYRLTQEKLEEFGQINFNSKQQVAALLYDELGFAEAKDRRGNEVRTAGGKRSASAATILSLKCTTAKQKEFISTYSKLAKLSTKLSKTLNFFHEVVENRKGLFYGIYNQGVVATHRLSSSGRNLITAEGETLTAQLTNMPREYKKLVKARDEGWEIWESDAAQVEFRIAAELGHDEVAYNEIANDIDVHQITADTLTQAGEPTARQEAKSRTFRPLFFGSSGTKAEMAYCEFFKEKYKGIHDEQNKWIYTCLRDQEFRTPYGMIFYFPGTKVTRSGYIVNSTQIANIPIQGLATGEIIPLVLIYLWHKLKDWPVRIILTVHDSIIMEVGPDADKEELRKIVAHAYTTVVYKALKHIYKMEFKTPLGAEIKAGPVWGEGKGLKVKAFPDSDELIWQT